MISYQETPLLLTPSRYYKLPLFDGMEALEARHYKTPFPPHYHPTFNITLVYEGLFQTQLRDKLVAAPAGSILITNPREIHANPFEKKDIVSFFTFYINPQFLAYCNNKKSVTFEQNVIYDDTLFAALHLLAGDINQKKTSPRQEENLKIALRELAGKYGSQPGSYQTEPKLDLFNEFIHTENLDKFSLADAANKFGIDKFKFIRLFKFQTGLTPNNYFILKRIEKSKAMLAEGKDLLSVAIDLGFYDTAHYCNHFKKFTGISPMAYLGSC